MELDRGEQCDDGNMVSGDGCSATCQIEPGFVCPMPGQPCVSTVVCGDGRIDGSEQCDSGRFNGTGVHCELYARAGLALPDSKRAVHDDMRRRDRRRERAVRPRRRRRNRGRVQCDVHGGRGLRVLERARAAARRRGRRRGRRAVDMPPDGMRRRHCGGVGAVRRRQSDPVRRVLADMHDRAEVQWPGDLHGGVRRRPRRAARAVRPWRVERQGTGVRRDLPARTERRVAVRGGDPAARSLAGYPDPVSRHDLLEHRDGRRASAADAWPLRRTPRLQLPPGFCSANGAVSLGEVQTQLGADGRPVFAFQGNPRTITDATSFCWWYHDTGCADGGPNPYAKLVYLDLGGNPTTLTLTQGASGTYAYANAQFFPLDGLGWNAGTNPELDIDCEPGLPNAPRNFSFTSELHYVFTFNQTVAASATPAVFNFTGDDDVWGFINNQLVIDLGGVHNPANASFTLNTANAASLGLVDGGWYSIDLFQAEAHVCRSTYALTLSNFAHVVTTCQTVCGDGIVAGNEQCDPGPSAGDAGAEGGAVEAGGADAAPSDAGAFGVYGGCNPNCTLGPYCGDGIVQDPPEQCDDGVNQVTYGGTTKQCGPGCKWAPYCGDGIVSNGEQCDNGANNVALAGAPYGAGVCTTACTLAPFCGDGVVQSADGEQCDDGPSNGSSGSDCDATCKIKCGNGALDPGEQCDQGASNVDAATMPYGVGICTTACRLAPYCGDGILQSPPEQCDYGTAGNTGSYGGCNPDCTIGPYCGDGIVQDPPEQCDNGANNVVPAAAYGAGVCTTACTAAPYCGDGVVELQFGEQCDGDPGCTSTCQNGPAK